MYRFSSLAAAHRVAAAVAFVATGSTGIPFIATASTAVTDTAVTGTGTAVTDTAGSDAAVDTAATGMADTSDTAGGSSSSVSDIVVTAQRLDEGRARIQTQTGASTYVIDEAA